MVETLYREAKHDPSRPLGAHLGFVLTYNALLAGTAWAAHRQGRLPGHLRWGDVALVGVGAYKIGRLVATDRVTLPIRAPFVEPQHEEPTGKGPRRALGELLTCPYCVAPWAALGLGAALVWAPRPTRFACGLLGAMTLADLLHRGYGWLTSRQAAAKSTAHLTEELEHELARGPINGKSVAFPGL